MTELLTSAQMRAIEAAAIASGAVTGLELMERAGRGVVEAIFAEWPELRATSHRAAVLCGPGGNGGDGFVVARLLKAWGWEVEVFLYGDAERMPPDARVNYERWVGMGAVASLSPGALSKGAMADLWVDSLFGTGLSRPVDPRLVQAVTALMVARLGGARCVSVDICSGLCADSGRGLGADGTGLPEVLRPDLTVTFHRAKPGHCLLQGAVLSGRLVVADIGLGTAAMGRADAAGCTEITRPGRLGKETGHKYAHGHALILSGGVGHGGAARLAARGAVRIGAGVVTVGCPPAALIENASQLNAIMLRPVRDAAGLAEVLADPRINALCLGPGMGVARATEMLVVALGRGVQGGAGRGEAARGEAGRGEAVRDEHAPYASRRCVVLDADALTALAQVPTLFALLHEDCILTPHGGEFARLFPDIAARLDVQAVRGPAYSKVDATREAAARAGCVVLFKGADTVIADPSGRCSINSAAYDRAAPWLATAGSGDVLAGFIVGLLARGFEPMQAAETAAWLHVECARSFGPGLIAEDLPEELPKVFRALGL